MLMTIIISSSVKPEQLRTRAFEPVFHHLPVLILRAVQRRALRFGVNVEHALPAP